MFVKAFILTENVAYFTSTTKFTQKKSEIVIPKENPNSSHFPSIDLTNWIYHSVNEQFQPITGTIFATAQSKCIIIVIIIIIIIIIITLFTVDRKKKEILF